MGVVPPAPGFNRLLAETCARHGALFVSDEVMTGFRVSRSGHWGLDGAVEGWAPRPDDVRQGDGRRLPGRGLRRPRRRDVDAVARRGPSTRPAPSRGTRSRPPPGWPRCGWPPTRSTPTSTRPAQAVREAAVPRRSPRPASRTSSSTSATCSACSSPTRASPRSRDFAGASAPARPERYKAFFHAMLDRGRLPPAERVRGVVPLRRPRRPRARPDPRGPARPPPRPPPPRAGGSPMSETGPPSTCCATARCTTRTGVLYGRLPGYHLSDLGQQMAQRSPSASATATSPTCVASPLERAQETAAAAGRGPGPRRSSPTRGSSSRRTSSRAAVQRRRRRSSSARRPGGTCGTRSSRRGASPTRRSSPG